MPRTQRVYTVEGFSHQFPGETEEVEFKSGFGSAPLQEAMVAFSNTRGGVIFVGIADDGAVLGQSLTQANESKANEAALAAHDVGRYAVTEITVGNHPVVAIDVQRRASGFAQTSDGRTLVRRGARNHALFGGDLQRFLNTRSLDRFESTPTRLTIADTDPALWSELAAARGWPQEIVRDRLVERGLAGGEYLTVAGALLLTHPTRSMDLQKCVIEVRRYPRDGVDYDRRETFGGPLHHQVREASKFIRDELGSDLVISGLYRHELPRLPPVVIREAIANAVAHRNYEVDRTPIVVELRADRVVIRSPGSLPEPVTIATMRAAQAARNPSIIDTLRDFALTEDAGRGVDVMQDTMKDALLEEPDFSDADSFVTVTLLLTGPITPLERVWLQELVHRGALSAADRLVIVHAARGEVLSNARAREALGTADSAEARKTLQRLRDAGLLVQSGERSGARYTLAKEFAPPAAFRMGVGELRALVVEAASTREITNSEVRDLTGLDLVATSRLLAGLVDEGRMVRIGATKGARYRTASDTSDN